MGGWNSPEYIIILAFATNGAESCSRRMSANGTSATFKRPGSMSASGPFSDIRAWPAYVAE